MVSGIKVLDAPNFKGKEVLTEAYTFAFKDNRLNENRGWDVNTTIIFGLCAIIQDLKSEIEDLKNEQSKEK